MPEGRRIDISPFLNIISMDMEIYTELFKQVCRLKWSQQYGKEESIAELNRIRESVGLKSVNPENELDFAKYVGECGRKIISETKTIREQSIEVLKSIMKEEITFGEEKSETEL